jgi:hypothetical protein
MKYYIALAVLLKAFVFSGCDDDEEDTGSFTMTVQGTEKNVTVKQATLTVSGGQNSSSGQSSHTLRIAAMVGEDSIYVGVSNWEFQEPPDNAVFTKDYYNVFSDNEELCHQASGNVVACEGVLIKYMTGDKLFGSYHKDDATLILHISKCDGQKVSGTFDITLENVYDNEDTKVVAGVFTDLSYTVKNSL